MDMSAEDYRLIGDQINTNHIDWLNKNFYATSYHHGQIWGDEANWTKYHAACWSALRNDSWTNMGFSPSAIASKNLFGHGNHGQHVSEKEFFSATSAYAALIDVFTLGGHWVNPNLKFDYIHSIGPEALGHTPKFIKFWAPMLNQLIRWSDSTGYLDGKHPFAETYLNRKFDLRTDEDRSSLIPWEDLPRIQGDAMHLSGHCLVPFEKGEELPEFREIYSVVNSRSYRHWADQLLNVNNIYEPTLVKVNVEVHFATNSQTTLGHFLLSPGETSGKDSKTYPVEVKYVNDLKALRMYQTSDFSI